MSLPSTITLTGLNTKDGFRGYPGILHLTLTMRATGPVYLSEAIPTVSHYSDTPVYATAFMRFAEATVSQKMTAKGEVVNSLLRFSLPLQLNEEKSVDDPVLDSRYTLMQTFVRDKDVNPTTVEDTAIEVFSVIAGASSGILSALSTGSINS